MMMRSRFFQWIAGLSALAIVCVIWAGFWFPDPYYLGRHPRWSGAAVWAMRLGIPAAALSAAWIARRVRSGRMSATGPLLLLGTAILLGLVLYPIADWRSHKRQEAVRNAAGMHAFLQLAPLPLSGRFEPAGGSFRIFCLGGSTTELPDSKGRDWPSRVQERLAGKTGRKDVSVVNCGRQWYTTLHLLIRYQTDLRPLKPDMIVVMETINDLLLNADFSYFSAGTFRPDYGHFFGPMIGPASHRSLLSAVCASLRKFWFYPERETVDTDRFPGLDSYRRNLEALVDLARMDGVKVVFMTQPNLFHEGMTVEEEKVLTMVNVEAVGPDRKWSAATAARGFQRYREVLIGVAQSRGVPLLELEAAVPKTLEYFKDDVHYRDPAYDLIADTVAGFLADRLTPGSR